MLSMAQPWLATAGVLVLAQALLIALLLTLLRRSRQAAQDMARERAQLLQRGEQDSVELQQLREQVVSMNASDSLTGVATRRRFDEALAGEWSRAWRSQQPLALALVDVDWFSKYNDRYGHDAGDDCLRHVAQVVRSVVRREGDLVARFGGKEFVFICAATDASAAALRAQSLCEALENQVLPHELSRYGVVTASIGVAAVVPGAGQKAESLLQLADRGLRQAKAQGRNRVVLAQPALAGLA